MEQRPLGRTGADVSVVGLGTRQLGADWGDVDDDTAADVLDAALDADVTELARSRVSTAPRGRWPTSVSEEGT